MTESTARIKALDLFAGTGWGLACQWLGIKESGVEIMDEAVATRTANGMETVYRDVWDGLELTEEQHRKAYGSYGLLIASPPCQTFSLAGKGAGRAALNEVLEAIELHAYKDAVMLKAFGEKHDPRTALVLTPLAYVWRDMPRLVAMEQVPTVLPVWEACADVMREWGYDVKVEILNAEQYGVPQTRKRAILVARRGGPVHMPIPTHSKYYSTNPTKLDPGVLKWISMAEALGWGAKDQPSHTVTAGVHGPTDRWASGGSSVRKALDAKIGGPDWIDKPNQDVDSRTTYAQRFDVEDVAAIQTYPTAIKNMGKGMVERYGERPGRTADQPAFTIRASAGGTEPGGFLLQEADGETRKLSPDEASALQSYPGDVVFRNGNQAKDPSASGDRVTVEEAATLQSYPAALVGFPRLADSGTPIDINGKSYRARDLRPDSDPAQTVTEKARSWKRFDPSGAEHRVTAGEASALQSFERPFVWCGTKTKQFLQIGNAVPPVLAEAILAALIGIRPGR